MDPFTGQPRFHRGVDLRAAYGSQVTSVAPGRVVWAGDQKGYGTTVVVEHGDGWCTRYAHLSTLAVKAGDVVSAGQEIGRAGSSGRSTGPHLHFEVTLRGEPVDPERFLPALDGAQVPLKKSGEVADSSYDGGSVRSPGASDED
jgi:murein DD-endopeptidase MepM/ murein hydrolase activator NlpD